MRLDPVFLIKISVADLKLERIRNVCAATLHYW
jgi:hypothetical protein